MINVVEITDEKLSSLHQEAKKVCEKEKVSNLILSGKFSIVELNSDWINTYKEKARKWQSADRDKSLEFNHGEYFDKYNSQYNCSAIDYLINELKTKVDSNRACWSLYDMSVLLHSGDKSIPSFMVLQVGILDKTLLLTAYYRALEVSKFLPINLAEICLVAQQINVEFSYNFSNVSIVIHAFNAYINENFSCFEKAKIDQLDGESMMMEICSTGVDSLRWIKYQLQNKCDIYESTINPSGIQTLIKCIQLYKEKTPSDTMDKLALFLTKALTKIEEYNKIRYVSSYNDQAPQKYEEIRTELQNAILKT